MAILSDLFRHNRWANLTLLEACAKLNDDQLSVRVPGTYGSTAATLMHLAGAERRYVQALRREERTAMPETFEGVEWLRAQLSSSGDDLTALADTIEAAEAFDREVDGAPWRIENRVVLVQAINHATEHRAHIMTTLSTLEVEPIDIDGWAWGEATGAAGPKG